MEDLELQVREAKQVLQTYANKQGHDSCWYYPEFLRQLMSIFDIKPTVPLNLPPRHEFRVGCLRYEGEVYGDNPHPDYD